MALQSLISVGLKLSCAEWRRQMHHLTADLMVPFSPPHFWSLAYDTSLLMLTSAVLI